MRLEQLLYFVEVARYKSFSIAAQHLHITQPSISHAITNLEEELSVKLFERSRSGITLTINGEKLLLKAQSVINIINEIQDETRAQNTSLHGELQIAAISSICNTYLSDVLSAFKKEHPFVRIEVTEEGSKQIMKDVLSNRVEIGVVSHIPDEPLDKKIMFNRLITGTYMACIGKKSSISFSNPIPKGVISNEPMVIFKPYHRQEEFIKKILKTDQINTRLSLGYTEAAKKIIAEGIAIGFYPDFSIKNDPYVLSGDLIPLDIEDNDLIIWFGWVRSKNRHLSKVAQEFIKILKQVIKEKAV